MNEDTRREERIPVAQLVIVGLVASAIGIAIGLVIEWFPPAASSQAGPIDHLWDVLIWASVPVFVLVTLIVLFCVWRFRVKPGEELLDGPPVHGNTRLEVIWTAIPAVILVVLCGYSWVVLNDIEAAEANEVRVNVTGQQFAWTYEYPQAGGEPLRSKILVLEKDRPVRFYIRALDVIHDFWVPAFRMKLDAVPGIETKYRITPDRLGTYPVVCAELCGLGHSVMRSTVRVVDRAEYAKWIAELKAPAQAAGGGPVDAKTLFTDGNGTATACGACHTLADAGTTSETGPDLDKAIAGDSPEDIEKDIVEPNAEIAPGFQPGVMPQNYGDTLSPEELEGLVKYLGEVAGK